MVEESCSGRFRRNGTLIKKKAGLRAAKANGGGGTFSGIDLVRGEKMNGCVQTGRFSLRVRTARRISLGHGGATSGRSSGGVRERASENIITKHFLQVLTMGSVGQATGEFDSIKSPRRVKIYPVKNAGQKMVKIFKKNLFCCGGGGEKDIQS